MPNDVVAFLVAGLALQLQRPAAAASRPYVVTAPDGKPRANVSASIDQIIRRVNEENERQGIQEISSGYVLAEFDMLLKPQQYEELYAKTEIRSPRKKRKVYKTARPWKGGVVNFLINPWDYSGQERAILYLAMAEWEQKTCIKFKPATAADSDKVMFQNGFGCNSQLGMVGGEQALNLQSPGCRYRGLYLHEIGHALGLVHEHQLPERDQYVDIIFENVKPEWRQWFDKYKASEVESYGIEYNVRSIMHYGITAFSKDDRSQTIRAKPRAGQTIEDVHLNELAYSDIKAINLMYNCSAHCPPGIKCDGTGFVSKDCKCYCPDGTSNCQSSPKIAVMQKPTCSNEAKDADCDTWARAKECAYNPLFMLSKCRRSCGKCEPLVEPTLPPKQCENVAGDADCAHYAKTGECYTSAAWMYLNCTAACGMCEIRSQNQGCIDLYPDSSQCLLWKQENMCDRKPAWMWANCRKTCGVCGEKPQGCVNKSPDDVCYARATTGDCDESAGFMLENCAKACGKCGNCFNAFPDDGACIELAARGECAQAWEWMGSKCVKACRLCDGWPANKPRPCMDLQSECAKWAAEGECQSNPSWMIPNCQLSCSRCDCVNKHSDNSLCEQWAKGGECSNNPAWMIDNCQKSCGACTNAIPSADRCRNIYTDSAKCDAWAKQGECESNPRFMIPNCRRSCTGCQSSTQSTTSTVKPGNCINKYGKDDECDAWAQSGECEANPSWMQMECARSCSRCGVECKNVHSSEADCVKWAAAGECARNPKWMQPNCMKACGGCSTATSTPVVPSQTVSLTTKKAQPVTASTTSMTTRLLPTTTSSAPVTTTATSLRTPVVTSSTVPPSTAAPCRNEYPDNQCRDFKLRQQCSANPSWMLKYCRKECTGCGGSIPASTLPITLPGSTATTTSSVSVTSSKTTAPSTSPSRAAITPGSTASAASTRSPITPGSTASTTARPPTTTAQPQVCQNTYNEKSCAGWAKASHCRLNPGWMLKYCYKSCTNCTSVNGEEESTVSWSDWGSYGPCSRSCGGGNRIRMRTCPRPGECAGKGGAVDTESEICNTQSCAIPSIPTVNESCVNVYGDDRACDIWAAARSCESNPLWMGAYCAKACRNCLKECRDVLEDDCPKWAAANECQNNPWMRHNCYKSCTTCADIRAINVARRSQDGKVIVPDGEPGPQISSQQSLVSEASCRNVYSDKTCDRLAAANLCKNSTASMRLYCAKTCGCPAPEASWTNWSRWSSCSQTCLSSARGSGIRLRTRVCSDHNQTCPGKSFVVEACRQSVRCRGS